MPVPLLDDLQRRARERRQLIPVAVAGAEEPELLRVLRVACDRGWVRPIVAGSVEAIGRLMAEEQLRLDGFTLVEGGPEEAVREVTSGRAALLMKGAVDTPALMRAVLHPEQGLRTGRTICQVVLMDLVQAGRRFLMADTGVCIQPTLEQKDDILRHTVEMAHALGLEEVRVAALA